MADCGGAITRMIQDIEAGDVNAADQLLEAVYDELRALAAARLRRERPGHSLEATALVHEAYLRLVGDGNGEVPWNNRAHFFGAAAEAMRRILIEQARRNAAKAHGGGRQREVLRDSIIATRADDDTDLIALSDALERLEREDADTAQLVKLRYFVGLTIPQAAEALGLSHATAERYWTYGRARLYQWISKKT